MILSFAWTTDALLAGRKKVTRRAWSKEYAAMFRGGTVHSAYDRLPRVHGKKVGDVKLCLPPYPERTRDIPDDDFELEGFKYMEEKGLLMRGRTPREYFEAWRNSNQVLFVVRFDLVFKCDRCGTWTTGRTFGYPENDKRLCALCWVDWQYYSETELKVEWTKEEWAKVYSDFLLTPRKRKGALV